jgi:hypothetical protein
MKLFNLLFKKTNQKENGKTEDMPFIPKDVFIDTNVQDHDNEKQRNQKENPIRVLTMEHINDIISLCLKDYSDIGYRDALITIDIAFRDEKLKKYKKRDSHLYQKM